MSLTRFTRTMGLGLLLFAAACRGGDEAAVPVPANSAANAAEAAGEAGTAAAVELRVWKADGKLHRFDVELAADQASQTRGLMGRSALPENGGMLFPFSYPANASFWMKDTSLPLDVIFIRPDGTIAAILEGRPNDLRTLSAGEAVSAVLEINRGRAAALGITTGDSVQWGNCAKAGTAASWRADRFCPGLTD